MILPFSRDPQINDQQNEKHTQKCYIAIKSKVFEPSVMALDACNTLIVASYLHS